MVLQTSNTMKPIEVEQKALSRFLLTRLGQSGMVPQQVEQFIRIFVRLVDKAVQEYNQAYELINEEVAEQKRPPKELEKGRILYFPLIVNELENCINTTNRLMNIFEKIIQHKDAPFFVQKIIRRHIAVLSKKPKSIRNIIEHIDDALLKGEIRPNESMILDMSEDASMISLGKISFSTIDLASLLKNLHEVALEITIYNVNTTYKKNFSKIAKR